MFVGRLILTTKWFAKPGLQCPETSSEADGTVLGQVLEKYFTWFLIQTKVVLEPVLLLAVNFVLDLFLLRPNIVCDALNPGI